MEQYAIFLGTKIEYYKATSPQIYRFYPTPVKISAPFCGNWQDDSIFFYEMQRDKNRQDDLAEKQSWRVYATRWQNLQNYSNWASTALAQTFVHWSINTHTPKEQSLETDAHMDSPLIYDDATVGQRGKGGPVNVALGYLDIHMEEQMALSPYLTTVTKLNSRRNADTHWKRQNLETPRE